jgi:hypothetical protein
MKVTQADAVSLLIKYADERTPVLAAFATPSLSVARVTGAVHFSTVAGILQLLIGEDDQTSSQIKFRLSDCIFEYGDFRGESDAQHFEAFLIIASKKGDTLSLFETKN